LGLNNSPPPISEEDFFEESIDDKTEGSKSAEAGKETSRSGVRTIYPVVTDFSQICQLMSLSASSRKVEKIIIHNRNGEVARILQSPMIHTIWVAEIGSLKSSMGRALKNIIPDEVVKIDDMTFAALVGTIDKNTHQLVGSFAEEANHCVAIIDEFDVDREGDLLKALLQLMESEDYYRRLGIASYGEYSVGSPTEGDGTYVLVKDGKLRMKTRTVWIIFTMYSTATLRKLKKGKAMVDRSLLIQFNLPTDIRKKIGDFELDFKYHLWNPPRTVNISWDEYQRLLTVADTYNPKIDFRLRDALIRTYAVIRKDGKTFDDYQPLLGLVANLKTPKKEWS
jgi:hypothetical protein